MELASIGRRGVAFQDRDLSWRLIVRISGAVYFNLLFHLFQFGLEVVCSLHALCDVLVLYRCVLGIDFGDLINLVKGLELLFLF